AAAARETNARGEADASSNPRRGGCRRDQSMDWEVGERAAGGVGHKGRRHASALRGLRQVEDVTGGLRH
ncbi:MAG: hypothetical protein JSV79_12150, partial [Armatimonadota bacterium]